MRNNTMWIKKASYWCDLVGKKRLVRSSNASENGLPPPPHTHTWVLWKQNTDASVIPIATPSPRLCVVNYTMKRDKITTFAVRWVWPYRLTRLQLQSRSRWREMWAAGEWVGDLRLVCTPLRPGAPRRPICHARDGRSSLWDYIFINQHLLTNMASWDVYNYGDNLTEQYPTTINAQDGSGGSVGNTLPSYWGESAVEK